MNNLFSFLIAHWILSGFFILTLILLMVHEWYHQKQGTKGLSPQELTNWANHENARLIDIRDSALFKKGHIAGSVLVDASLLSQVAAAWHDKTQAIIVICSSGVTAVKVASQLQGMGFSKIAVLSGGIRSWQADSLPLVQGK
jgi:rhodanese-related sulfurtransferase